MTVALLCNRMELVKSTGDRSSHPFNRRRTVRLSMERLIQAQAYGSDAGLAITDVSFRGMKAQATAPFWPGACHVVRVASGQHGIELHARVVYCQRAVTDCGAPCYVVGWEFLSEPGVDESADELVALVAGEGPFDLVS